MTSIIRSLDEISWPAALVLIACIWSFTTIACTWLKLKGQLK